MLKLFCAIVGVAGSAFPVDIKPDDTVGDLKKAIAEDQKFDFAASKLQLFLVKTHAGWLPDNEDLDTLLQSEIDTSSYLHMRASWKLSKPNLFGPGVSLGEDVVHVLVVVPEKEQTQTGLWLVTGSVENAFNTKGVRSRLYQLVGSYLGYYDPARSTGDALWYEGKTLNFHALFKTEENALLFENVVREERFTPTSPLNGHTVSTNVTPVSRDLTGLRRIYSEHYVPQETVSPQNSLQSHSTKTSIVDVVTDEFKYQRIESEKWFGTIGKAESCHLMSREHCRKYASYLKYDNDPSNRLALSPAMHAWYDGRSCAVPVFNISVESVSVVPVIRDRYKVDLVVRAFNAEYAILISQHMKEGFIASEDGLEMRTSVYVQNPKVFRECMEWKRKDIEKQWKSFCDMVPAVD